MSPQDHPLERAFKGNVLTARVGDKSTWIKGSPLLLFTEGNYSTLYWNYDRDVNYQLQETYDFEIKPDKELTFYNSAENMSYLVVNGKIINQRSGKISFRRGGWDAPVSVAVKSTTTKTRKAKVSGLDPEIGEKLDKAYDDAMKFYGEERKAIEKCINDEECKRENLVGNCPRPNIRGLQSKGNVSYELHPDSMFGKQMTEWAKENKDKVFLDTKPRLKKDRKWGLVFPEDEKGINNCLQPKRNTTTRFLNSLNEQGVPNCKTGSEKEFCVPSMYPFFGAGARAYDGTVVIVMEDLTEEEKKYVELLGGIDRALELQKLWDEFRGKKTDELVTEFKKKAKEIGFAEKELDTFFSLYDY